jgi:hypothetical protein
MEILKQMLYYIYKLIDFLNNHLEYAYTWICIKILNDEYKLMTRQIFELIKDGDLEGLK